MDKKRIQAPGPRPRHTQTQSSPPTTLPPEKDLHPDDLVPSLPPNWQLPAFSTWEMQSSDDVSENDEEVKNNLNDEVSMM